MSSDPPAADPMLGPRAAARLVDVLLLAALGVAWGYPLDYNLVWLVAHASLVFLYFVAGTATGRTLGKAALGLRVVGPAGEAPGWSAAARREAFVLVGAVPFVGPIIAMGLWIAIFVTARRSPLGQGLHDGWAGGTRVVRVG